MYMLSTNRTRLLDSCYLESQTWGALHKAWKGYVIAKNRYKNDMNEVEKMFHYAEIIQKLQGELGLRISSFPELGLVPQQRDIRYDVSENDDYDVSENNELE